MMCHEKAFLGELEGALARFADCGYGERGGAAVGELVPDALEGGLEAALAEAGQVV